MNRRRVVPHRFRSPSSAPFLWSLWVTGILSVFLCSVPFWPAQAHGNVFTHTATNNTGTVQTDRVLFVSVGVTTTRPVPGEQRAWTLDGAQNWARLAITPASGGTQTFTQTMDPLNSYSLWVEPALFIEGHVQTHGSWGPPECEGFHPPRTGQ